VPAVPFRFHLASPYGSAGAGGSHVFRVVNENFMYLKLKLEYTNRKGVELASPRLFGVAAGI
jgi:hypothetical protein